MLDEIDRQQLLAIAKDAIAHGLQHGRPLLVNLQDYPEALQQPAATFVTLTINKELRGCIGSLQARRPLVQDVAENAYAAAFRDSRFPQLQHSEFPQLEYHISILTPAEDFPVSSEQELLEKLQPFKDGLILEEGFRRATFLPSVWESLSDPQQFLSHLKMKAGLSADHWSDTIRFQRYRVEEFG